MSIPPKIRVFWWRAFHNIIPTEMNLRRHHVPISGRCPLCNYHEDSTCHALLYCQAVKRYWKDNGIWKRLKQFPNDNMNEICQWLMEHTNSEDCEEFVCQAWLVWSERCRAIHDSETRELRPQTIRAQSFLEEYRHASKLCVLSNPAVGQKSPNQWDAPPIGHLRLDVDASFPNSGNIGGIGGVIRDHEGHMLAAFGRTIPKPESIAYGELLAVREGLKEIRDRGFHHIHVSSDSLLAVQAVTEPMSDLSYVGLCATEIKDLFQELDIIEFFHVRRTANAVAHSLASFALSSPSPFYWVSGNFPTWLVTLVMKDIHISQ